MALVTRVITTTAEEQVFATLDAAMADAFLDVGGNAATPGPDHSVFCVQQWTIGIVASYLQNTIPAQVAEQVATQVEAASAIDITVTSA